MFVGTHVIGFGVDDPTKPAKTMLGLMVCPMNGAPSFIARLIPVCSLKADFLYEQTVPLIKIVHECGGFVFLLMTDNLKANITFYNSLAKEYTCINSYSVKHPVNNELFKELYTLFDPIHLFKNINNN